MAQLFAELPADELNGEILDAFNQIDSNGSGSLDRSRFLALSRSPCISLLLQQKARGRISAKYVAKYVYWCFRACVGARAYAIWFTV